MGWAGDVINKNVKGLEVDAAKAAKGGILGLIGVATGGLLGRQPEGQQQVADRNGVLPRAPSAGTDPARQATDSLRRIGQQNGIGVPEQTGQTGLGSFLGKIGDAFSRRILPSDGMVERLKGGATAITGTVTGIAAGVASLGQDGSKVPVEDRSTYSAAAIAEAKAAGRDTKNMKLTPPETPIVTAAATAPTALVTAPEVTVSPVAPPSEITTRPLSTAPTPATTAPDPKAPIVTSDVKPAEDFKVAAAPATATPDAAPAVKAPAVAEFHARSGDDVYARAQAYVAKNTGPGAGPG
jgi:hypothetical protein